MSGLVIITVFIEKRDDQYTAFSPNLPGVAATGNTREEVEREMLRAIESSIDETTARHRQAQQAIEVAPKPLLEKIRCVALVSHYGREPSRCQLDAAKDGLCFLHWRTLYGHAIDGQHRHRCDVCGETDPEKLKWDVTCPVKPVNPQWHEQLLERRRRERERRSATHSVRRS